MQYYAHISEDKTRKQTVKDHLTGTARRSELFAEAFRCGAWGYGCGVLHDIGKYSQGFRKRLEGGSGGSPGDDAAVCRVQSAGCLLRRLLH